MMQSCDAVMLEIQGIQRSGVQMSGLIKILPDAFKHPYLEKGILVLPAAWFSDYVLAAKEAGMIATQVDRFGPR